MARPPHQVIARVQGELRQAGRPAGYYDACRELGRRGGRKRKTAMGALSMPDPSAQGRNCLPPGDRE